MLPVTLLQPQEKEGVEKNTMLEFRVNLDSLINTRIAAFVGGDEKNGINPFDPEQIDVQSEFWVLEENKWYGPEKRYGFYYEEYERDTRGNVENWDWDRRGLQHEFRIRFTPRYEGLWLCRSRVIINKRDTIHVEEFTFKSIRSDKKGFIEIGDDKRSFRLEGNVFMPLGTNMSHPRWMDDPDQLRQGTAEYIYELRKMPAMPIAFINYLEDIENLAGAGGNYFRMMLFPFANDIEFEELNDYSDRMHIAWEMDRTIQKAEETGVKIHFVLTWANELNIPERSYNKVYWDWYANNFPWVEDDRGYCYMRELGLKEPYEFLTDESAIKFYKHKLRYMMSRWGYSTSIGIIELMNEINLVFPDHPRERMYWQNEISTYLKEELQVPQPLSVNYGGPPDIEKGDSSYYLKNIDVITFNEYRIPGLRTNFIEHLSKYRHINKPFMFSEIGVGYGELCGCEKFSEYRKDLWLTMFSGMAATGLEWSQQRSFDLFAKYYPVLSAFSKDVSFNLFESYESDHRKDKSAEVLAIKDMESNRAVGVVHNATWNYYTNRIDDSSPCGQTPPDRSFQTYKEVHDGMGAKALHLNGFSGKTKFQIDWYNATTGEFISTEFKKSSRNGKIRIKYPELSGDNNLLAFKLYVEGTNFISGDLNEDTETKIDLPVDNSIDHNQ